MTKLVIVNTTHFANKGSMGRIEGITILHRYYRKDKDTLVKQLIEEHPNLEVKEHPWFRETSSDMLTALNSLVRFCLLATWRNTLRKLGLPLKSEIQGYDAVIDLNLIEPTEGVYFTMTVGNFFCST